MLNNLQNFPHSRKKKKRVGRGPGSTLGKTCGRGHKGQGARSGSKTRIGFEGGQMPLHRRLPKRGFTNIHRVEYYCLNLKNILASKKLDLTQTITIEALIKAGMIKNTKNPLKILGDGSLTSPLSIEANKFTVSAQKKIQEAGGIATIK